VRQRGVVIVLPRQPAFVGEQQYMIFRFRLVRSVLRFGYRLRYSLIHLRLIADLQRTPPVPVTTLLHCYWILRFPQFPVPPLQFLHGFSSYTRGLCTQCGLFVRVTFTLDYLGYGPTVTFTFYVPGYVHLLLVI